MAGDHAECESDGEGERERERHGDSSSSETDTEGASESLVPSPTDPVQVEDVTPCRAVAPASIPKCDLTQTVGGSDCLARYTQNLTLLSAGDVTLFPAVMHDVFSYLTECAHCTQDNDMIGVLLGRAADLLQPLYALPRDTPDTPDTPGDQNAGCGGTRASLSRTGRSFDACCDDKLFIMCACVIAARLPIKGMAFVHGTIASVNGSRASFAQTACVLFLCAIHWDATYSVCALLPCVVLNDTTLSRPLRALRRHVL